MIIKADKEARIAIEQLCDIALKAGGIQNLNGVGKVLDSIKPIEQQNESEKTDGGTE